MGFILFVIATILTSICTCISMIATPLYYIITFRWISGFKQLNNWFYKMALSLDQFGNVCNRETLKILLSKKDGHPFGDEDDTVSYVIGRNKYKRKLTVFGWMLERILNLCERNHCEIAIQKKIDRDIEASFRASNEKYFE